MKFAVYKNKLYKTASASDKIFLLSKVWDIGFYEQRYSKGVFEKEVVKQDVSKYYNEIYYGIYKDEKFQIISIKNGLIIACQDKLLAERLNFDFRDRGEYIKKVDLDELDGIVIEVYDYLNKTKVERICTKDEFEKKLQEEEEWL